MNAPHDWHRRARPLLGTRVEVSIRGATDAESCRLSDLAFDRIARYHALMSFHEATSDVRRIASARAGQTVRIAPETWNVIAAALAFETESDGVFDVAVASEMVARGHLPPMPAALDKDARTIRGTSARHCLRLDADARITVLRPVWIDLGGIAKGAAVDAALAAIRSGDVGAAAFAAIVNAGGDLAVYGTERQPVTVRGADGILRPVGSLADGAIATSGPFGDAARSSLILGAGRGARWAGRTVSVVAPTCQTADALTKVLAALGPEAAPLLARHAAQGFSIDAGGRLECVQ